ncbi:MAG: hypothetical protein WD059_12085 [Balneolaceae bacterium]
MDEQKVEGVFYNSSSGFIEVEAGKMNQPMMSDEILEAKLTCGLSSLKNTVDAIRLLKSILAEELDYAPKTPLVNFAIILRKVFAQQLKMEDKKENFPGFNYGKQELVNFIEESISKQHENLYNTYVRSGKISSNEYDKFIITTSDVLKSEYIGESEKEGFFEHFQTHFPDIEYDNYRNNHRKILEYVVKNVRVQLISALKREEKFSSMNRW